MEQEELIKLDGSVEGVIFHNADNGFSVVEMECNNELITIVGELPQLSAGEDISVTGVWAIHPNFGRQFKVSLIERSMPTSSGSILKYLSSGAIKGIGPATAHTLVKEFGDKTLEVIENAPERLASIKGISKNKAISISEEYKKQFGVRCVMLFFQQYGITPSESVRIWKKWGNASVDIIKSNPYMVCGISRISFERADAIANTLGLMPDCCERISAGIIHVLKHNRNNGHTYIPREKLLEASKSMLDVSLDKAEISLDQLLLSKSLISVNLQDRHCIFLPEFYRAEKFIAGRIQLMLRAFTPDAEDISAKIDKAQNDCGVTFAPEQRDAIYAAISKGVMILTGGPGTGKTTTINGIIRLLEDMELKVVLAAPTGRAAKRMTELVGREAKTIHRLLEMEFDDNDIQRFARNEGRPLECDAIIVDEISMVDIMLMESLLRALRLGCRLIMVGDADQLPPVGAGNVLRDLIACGYIPIIKLKHIFRQAALSLIVTNAHKIVKGEMPILDSRDADFFFLPCQSDIQVARTVKDLCFRRLPEAYNLSPLWDIQVIAPGRKGPLGTGEINRMLQEALNPPSQDKNEVRLNGMLFREGDKLMQIKNNYDLQWKRDNGEEGAGIFNGDIGVLTKVMKAQSTFTIKFEDRCCKYGFEQADELELAYAITTHKSQGSEFRVVILPLFSGSPHLFYRNLLYTAVTRAKEKVIIAGSENAIKTMVENARKALRYSALKEFIILEAEENAHNQ
jgi:exodeoxyribonuclease V alpha subunit